MKKSLLLVAATAIAASAVAAHADTAFNTDVTTPPGVFFGTGNTNGAFAIDTDTTDGIELGLRGKLAIVAPTVAPEGGNTDIYDLPMGSQPAQANGIAANPARSAWGIDYSINVTKSGNSLSSYIAQLTVLDTTNSSTITTWDVLGNAAGGGVHVTDDEFSNADGSVIHTTTKANPTFVINPIDVVAQNSENAAFFSGLNFNSSDDYEFTLSIFNNNGSGGISGSALASDTIFVTTVPTPLPSAASMGLGMLAVIGAAGMLRKKLRTA